MLEDILIIDCETTAAGDDPEKVAPIEISILSDGSVATFRMNPKVPMLPSAVVVHGISPKEVEEYRPIEEVIPGVYTFFQQTIKASTVLSAYNSQFDFEVIHRAFDKHLDKSFKPKHQLDILRLARKLIPFEKIGGYKLDAVFCYLFSDRLNELLKARAIHSGAQDVKLEEEVLDGLWELLEQKKDTELSLDEVVEFAGAPMWVAKWPFKKSKGQPVEKVVKDDPGYVNWFLQQPWASSGSAKDLAWTIQQIRAGKTE